MKSKRCSIMIAVWLIWISCLNVCIPVRATQSDEMIGGINLLKTDVFGNGLSGASYQVAREATLEELKNSSVPKRLLKAGEDLLTVVYTSFWDSREMAGKKVMEVSTNPEGTASIYGLRYGTYYLVESKAPEGYDRMSAPIRFTVNKYSHLTAEDNVRDDENAVIDNTMHIVTIRYPIPKADRNIAIQMLVSGLGFIGSLVALLWLTHHRVKQGV